MATTSKTPNYQLPRPNETDIMDVADLQGIVDKVDAQMKVNATNIGLLEAAGLSGALINGYRVLKKVGIVHVTGYVKTTTQMTTSYQSITVIPSDFRPITDLYFERGALVGNARLTYFVGQNGDFKVKASTTLNADTSIDCALSWIALT